MQKSANFYTGCLDLESCRFEKLYSNHEWWGPQWHKNWDLYCSSWVSAEPFAAAALFLLPHCCPIPSSVTSPSHMYPPPVLVFESVQSLLLVFSSYHCTITPLLNCSTLWAFFCPDPAPQLCHLTPLPPPLCLRQDTATFLAHGPAWRALNTRDKNFLIFSMSQSHGCYQMQFFQGSCASLCSWGLEQAHFHYYCLEITKNG